MVEIGYIKKKEEKEILGTQLFSHTKQNQI
jgi:hypothetical protein